MLGVIDVPSAADRASPLSSSNSSPLELGEKKSSSESMPTLAVVVTGVGGAAGTTMAAEAITFLFGTASLFAEVIFASAAVRFLVVGGMVAVR